MGSAVTQVEQQAAEAFVVEVVREHASSLLALARRYSYCADDAADAYQRGLEIFLRRARDVERATAVSWLRTVIKHEALSIRAARSESVSALGFDLDRQEATRLPTADEQIARFDRTSRAAEALQRLKPQEVTALLLKAEGHSYREISEQTGWTYTKVNRCITEGRRRFIERYTHIESGAECERWQPSLSAMADGEASARQVLELRPHLRSCPACRAALREHHGAARRVAALMPAGLVLAGNASAHRPGGLVMRTYEALTGGVHERLSASALKLQTAAEAATSGKLAAVAASTAALAGGGGVILHEELASPHRAAPIPSTRRAAHVRRTKQHRAAITAGVAPAVTPVPAPAPADPTTPSSSDLGAGSSAPAKPTAPSTVPAPTPPAAQTPAPAQQEFAPEQPAAAPSSSAPSRARSAPLPARAAAPAGSSSGSSSGEFTP